MLCHQRVSWLPHRAAPARPLTALQLLEQLAQAGLGPAEVEQLYMHYESVRKAEGGDKVTFTTGGAASCQRWGMRLGPRR